MLACPASFLREIPNPEASGERFPTSGNDTCIELIQKPDISKLAEQGENEKGGLPLYAFYFKVAICRCFCI